MKASIIQNQVRSHSKLAGAIYLIIAVIGGFSIGYMPGQIVVEGDSTQTFQNLIENQGLFRLGIAGDIAVMVLEILLTVMLFHLFKPVSKIGMRIATYSRFAMAVIMGMNLINYMIPAILMVQPEYLSSFSPAELESMTLLFFQAHKYGELTWQIFFAIHIFTLGFVICKLGKTSKWLGIIMLLGGIGYGGDSVTRMTLMNSEILTIIFSVLLVFAVVGELWFAVWLMVKGGKDKVME